MFRSILTLSLITFAAACAAQTRTGERAMVVESNPTAQFNGGRKWAVVVGVNDYAFLADLEFCVDDARLIAETLREKCGYPEDNILLIDSEQTEAGRRPAKVVMRRRLAQWLSQPKANDTVFVYFSGHGFERDGKRYFAPADCDPSEPEETCYSLEMLSQLMADCPARQKVLVLDCCRNDPSKSFGDSSGNEELAAAFKNAEGMITLASCRRGQVSWEWKEKKQGLYTYFLAEGLSGGADYDRDGIVDSGELNRFLSAKVPLESRKQGREQQPVEIRNDTTGVFALSQVQHAPTAVAAAASLTSGKIEAAFTVREEDTKSLVANALVKVYWKSDSDVKLLASGTTDAQGKVNLPVELTLEHMAEGKIAALVRRGEKAYAYQLPDFPRQRTWPLTAPKLTGKPEEPVVANNQVSQPLKDRPNTIRPASHVRREAPEQQDWSGIYQIRSFGNNRLLYINGTDELLSTRSIRNDKSTLFKVIRATKGTYIIQSLHNGKTLHANGQADHLVSTRYQVDDIYSRFFIEEEKQGVFTIQCGANKVNLHLEGNGDKLVSTRFQENDLWTRFELVKVSVEFLRQLQTVSSNTASASTTASAAPNANCPTGTANRGAQQLNQMRNQSGWGQWSEWKPVNGQPQRNFQRPSNGNFNPSNNGWNNGRSQPSIGGGLFGIGFGF